jgi:V8-like Glu-specific endopeptidase
MKRYFHIEGTSNVHTGTILGVAEDESYFSHDINTYKGCSGAIVFLLDQNQPDHVRSRDHGKAIAIHGGADFENNRKFAFTIKM